MNGCKIERDYSYTGSGRDRYFIIDRSGDTSGAFYAKTTNSSSGFLKLGKEENNRHVFYPIPPNDGTTGRLSSDYDIIGKIVRGNTCKVCCEKPVTPPGSCNESTLNAIITCIANKLINPSGIKSGLAAFKTGINAKYTQKLIANIDIL